MEPFTCKSLTPLPVLVLEPAEGHSDAFVSTHQVLSNLLALARGFNEEWLPPAAREAKSSSVSAFFCELIFCQILHESSRGKEFFSVGV